MQHLPPLCRLVSTSQWRSLSLYLSLRHSYTSRAGSYATDKTNSTTNKTSNLNDRAGKASAKKSGYPKGNETSPVRTYVIKSPVKRYANKNKNDPRRISRRAGNHDNQARKGVRRDDNSGKKRGTGTENRRTARLTLYYCHTKNMDAMAARRLAQGMGGSADRAKSKEEEKDVYRSPRRRSGAGDIRSQVKAELDSSSGKTLGRASGSTNKAKSKEEEHDVYRPLRRRSGAGDIRSQIKAELDSSRGKTLGRASGSSSRRESRSLLDEVFPPNESKAQADSTSDNEPSEMPRLTLEHLIKDEEYKVPTRAQSEEERLRMFYKAERENLGKEKGILLIRGLSPSMEDEDFRRLSPKGKHIEGWEHELGNILKVIPGRDLDTLEKTGAYYLVFASPESAMVYKEEAERRHALSKMYRPHDINSPVPPPPGYLVNGEDVHALVESFTLVPPRQKLLIMPIHEPFDDLVQSLVDHGGYKALRQGQQKQDQLVPDEPRTKVLVSVDGPTIPFMSILDGINLDGKSRGWHWNIIKKNPVSKLDFTGWRGVGPGQYETPANQSEILRRRNRCTVEFNTESEAKRFARAWHCTRLPEKGSVHDNGTEGPTVSAEVVW